MVRGGDISDLRLGVMVSLNVAMHISNEDGLFYCKLLHVFAKFGAH
jgi:hypothetical protein